MPSKAAKYNFFNVFYLKDEFISLFIWFGFLVNDFRRNLISNLNVFIKNSYLYNFYFSNNFLLNYINTNYLNILSNARNALIFKDSGKFVYFWESMIEILRSTKQKNLILYLLLFFYFYKFIFLN